MAVKGLVDRVGSGMINLIFFDNGGKLDLVGWEKTNQRALTWIKKTMPAIKSKLPWEEWPNRVVVVFVIFEGEHHISVEHIGQLVRTKRNGLEVYDPKEMPRDEGDAIERHVSDNWEIYRKIEGVM
jgi:alpha-tubulin suppressor-like RCC1 family protein